MKKILIMLKKKLIQNILLATVAGIIFGSVANPQSLKLLIPVVLFMMVFPMFLKVKVSDLITVIQNPKPILLGILLNATLIPLYGYLLSRLFFINDPELMMGLLLMALLPTGGMTPTWTGFAEGDIKSSILMMTVNLLFSMILIPIYLNFFLGTSIVIDNSLIFVSLIKTVILPLFLANITRIYLDRQKGSHYIEEQKNILSGISSLGVIALVFIAMALKSNTILNNPTLSLQLFVPLILFYLGNLLLSHWAGSIFLSSKERPALVYSTTLRNLTIALAISISISTDSMAVLLIALANVVQQPTAVLYLKLNERFLRTKTVA